MMGSLERLGVVFETGADDEYACLAAMSVCEQQILMRQRNDNLTCAEAPPLRPMSRARPLRVSQAMEKASPRSSACLEGYDNTHDLYDHIWPSPPPLIIAFAQSEAGSTYPDSLSGQRIAERRKARNFSSPRPRRVGDAKPDKAAAHQPDDGTRVLCQLKSR